MKQILIALILVFGWSCMNQSGKVGSSDLTPTTDSIISISDAWNIKVYYPTFQHQYLDSVTTKYISESINNFKSTADEEAISENWKNELLINYEIVTTSHKIISIVFSYYTYTGGAHGNTFHTSLVLSPLAQKSFSLDDFFNGNVLETIQTPTRKYLQTQLTSTDFIEVGTATMADFSVFSVTDNDITFWFSPYQVAAYSEGTQKVTIPLINLENFHWPLN